MKKETYFALLWDKSGQYVFKPRSGYKIEFPEYDITMFVEKDYWWNATEKTTGTDARIYGKTRKECIKNVKKLLAGKGKEKIYDALQHWHNQHGYAPDPI